MAEKSKALFAKRRLHVPLWSILPALANRDSARSLLTGGESNPSERRQYLRDVIRAGDEAEKELRQHHYYEDSVRGDVFRRTGYVVDDEEEAKQILSEMETQNSGEDA